MVSYTIDTSFAVKGMIPPRRRKQDDVLEQQQRMYAVARSYLDKVKRGEAEMYIPAIALVESGIVVSRITNNEEDSRGAVSFLRWNASRVFYDHELLDEAITLGIQIKASGYDTIFLTVAEKSGSELLTDDSLQHRIAVSRGIPSHLLREMI
ncbi:MAG: PIN domain-containing protein [Desulfobacterales bacterium]|nr:PIN domain-containing protein [Desulfobacterales bacterium]